MTRFFALAFAAALSVCVPAVAADTPPWTADDALERAAMADVQSSGVLSVKTRLADLEAALARANASIAAANASTPTRFVLTDGLAQVIAGMALAAHDKVNGFAAANPYPQIGLILGSYYNEIGKPEDAVRVMDIGIACDTIAGIPGETMPVLKGERANALTTLKRYADALAAYDEALAQSQMDAGLRAHLQRGRGFALTEMGRLDDAEKSYRDSLELAPGNATALQELDYIAGLKAGQAPAASGGLKPLQPSSRPESQSSGQ